MADYTKIIDAETWDFISKTAEYYPADATQMSIQDQRQVYDDMSRAFFQGYPDGLTVRDRACGHIKLREYVKSDTETVVAFFHGGGFVVGGLESHDDVCAEICDRTGFAVLAVDYRLSPEHLHPAAFDDALVALKWAVGEYDVPIILAGDSAGGNLASAVAHATRGEDLGILGQILIYPGLGGDVNSGTFIEHAHAPMLNRDEVLFHSTIRTGGVMPAGDDPTMAPLVDKDFSNLPKTAVFSAECDPLSGDGKVYCDEINAAGGQAVWRNEVGLVHGYLRARTTVKRARDSFTRIINAISDMGQRS